MDEEPTVARDVGVKSPEQVRLGRTDRHVVLRFQKNEFEMIPSAARELAKALVTYADAVEADNEAR